MAASDRLSVFRSRQYSAPTTPPAGMNLLYPKADGKWYTKDSAGVEALVGSGGTATTDASLLTSGTLADARLPSRLATAPPAVTTDLNTATSSGWYSAGNTSANTPVAGQYYNVEVAAWLASSNYTTQTAYDVNNGQSWTRQQVAGAWFAWRRMDPEGMRTARITSGNNSVADGRSVLLCSTGGEAGTIATSLVIQTNITFGDYMLRFSVRGFNYVIAAQNLDLEIGFYAYSGGPTVINYGATSNGDLHPSQVRVMRTADNRVALVIDSTGWAYPKLAVDVITGYNDVPDSALAGWTGTWTNTLTGLTAMQTVPVTTRATTSSTYSTDLNTAIASGWVYGNPATLNVPVSGYFSVLTVVYGDNGGGNLTQIAYELNANRSYVRVQSGGVWGAWRETDPEFLRARANHTGTQPASTITGLAAVATSGSKADVGLNNVPNVDTTVASNITSGTLPDSRLPARLAATAGTLADANTLTSNGWYSVANTGTNTPVSGNYYNIEVIAWPAGGYVTQIAYDVINGAKFVRQQSGGAWGLWRETDPEFLRARANHTGTQPASTITGLASAATTGLANGLLNYSSAAPGSPVMGQLWYDVPNSQLKVYTGAAWVSTNLPDAMPVGTVFAFAGVSAPNACLVADGSSQLRTAYPDLFAALTFSVTGSGASGQGVVTTSTTTNLRVGMRVEGANLTGGAGIITALNPGVSFTLDVPLVTTASNASFKMFAHGAVDNTHFNLPLVTGRVPVGRDGTSTEFASVGQTGGEKTHILLATEMPSHFHTGPAHQHSFGAWYAATTTTGGTAVRLTNITANGDAGTGGGGFTGAAGTAFNGLLTSTSGSGNTGNAGGDGAHNNLQPYTTMLYVVKATAASSTVNLVIPTQAAAPLNPVVGTTWYDSVYDINKIWAGAAWEAVGYGPTLKQRVNVTVNSAAFSAETVLATLPAITVDGSTEIELVFSWYNFAHSVATDTVQCYLYDGSTAGSGTLLQVWLQTTAANGGSGTMRWRGTPSAGTHTYTARAMRSQGTGTAQLVAVATDPAQLTVNPV